VHARVETGSDETPMLEACVLRFGDGTFVEERTIRCGIAGAVTFETIGRGWVDAGSSPGPVQAASCGSAPRATAASRRLRA
jgi:hypothetical protein